MHTASVSQIRVELSHFWCRRTGSRKPFTTDNGGTTAVCANKSILRDEIARVKVRTGHKCSLDLPRPASLRSVRDRCDFSLVIIENKPRSQCMDDANVLVPLQRQPTNQWLKGHPTDPQSFRRILNLQVGVPRETLCAGVENSRGAYGPSRIPPI
jgi:hypothetical protein